MLSEVISIRFCIIVNGNGRTCQAIASCAPCDAAEIVGSGIEYGTDGDKNRPVIGWWRRMLCAMKMKMGGVVGSRMCD